MLNEIITLTYNINSPSEKVFVSDGLRNVTGQVDTRTLYKQMHIHVKDTLKENTLHIEKKKIASYLRGTYYAQVY